MKKDLIKTLLGETKILKKDMIGIDSIKEAQNIINLDGINPEAYIKRPYLVSTQNLSYQESLAKNSENAFIILGSGDNLFELLQMDIKNIIAIDTSKLQILTYKLKKAAILSLNKKEYEKFLIDYTNLQFLSSDIYNYVKENLKSDVEAYNFWNALFEINPKDDLTNHYFKAVGIEDSRLKNSLKYFRKFQNYKKVQENLEKVNIRILEGDALEHLSNSNEKYDYIDLTNILIFLYQLSCDNNEVKYLNKLQILNKIYNKSLESNGIFIFDYLFGIDISTIENNLTLNDTEELIKNIYRITYKYLNENFKLEFISLQKIIDGFGPKQDTIVYTKKIV